MELKCLEACLLIKAAFRRNAETVNKTNQYESANETNFLILVADRSVPPQLVASIPLVVLSPACKCRLPPELLLDGDAPRAKANSARGNNSNIFPDQPDEADQTSVNRNGFGLVYDHSIFHVPSIQFTLNLTPRALFCRLEHRPRSRPLVSDRLT